MDMDALWERIQQLEGCTLVTVTGKPFDVAEVTPTRVHVVLHSTGMARSRLQRRRFERAAELGLVTPTVRPSELQEAKVTSHNSSYIAAIIQAVLK